MSEKFTSDINGAKDITLTFQDLLHFKVFPSAVMGGMRLITFATSK